MKTFASLLVLIFSFYSFSSEIDIKTAIQHNLIKVETDYLSLKEEGMELTVTNLQGKRLTILIPSGTEFVPDNVDEQPLLNIEDEFLVINSNDTKSIKVGAYCLDLDKNAPSYSTNFNIIQTKNEKAIVFLDYIKKHEVTPSNYQAALWALINYDDIANVYPHNDEDVAFREFIAKETERENPWYSNENELVAEPGRPIENNSVSISGTLNIKLDKDVNFEMVVIDLTTNEVVRTFSGKGQFKKGWENNLKFSLEVYGWEKGDYEVVLRDSDNLERLKDFPFVI